MKRISLTLVALLLTAMGAGFTYEQIARSAAERNFPPEGELISVGGHKLHFVRKGEGGPTVVFESGLERGGHLPWFRVQHEIAKVTTTLSYDRAGILWSERGTNPKSGAAMATELHALLEATDVPKPYILVGHSVAGVTSRSFIVDYSDDIAGVVMVDASHPDQMQRLLELGRPTEAPPRLLMEAANSLGILRLLLSNTYPGTIESDAINLRANALAIRGISGALDEMINLPLLVEEAAAITSYGDIPLIVITGAAPDRFDGEDDEELRAQIPIIWGELQADALTLSSDSKQVLAIGSGHYVQLEEPEIVIDAIRELIERAMP